MRAKFFAQSRKVFCANAKGCQPVSKSLLPLGFVPALISYRPAFHYYSLLTYYFFAIPLVKRNILRNFAVVYESITIE